jgi:hypothetical protein
VEVREYDVRKPFGAIIIYPADHHTVDTLFAFLPEYLTYLILL